MSLVVTALAWAWAVLLPPLLGAVIARAVLGRGAPPLLVVAAGVGLGHGATSALLYSLSLAGSSSALAIVALEALALATAAVTLSAGRSADGCWPVAATDSSPLARWARRAAALAVVLAVVHFVMVFVKNPHGGWDTWAIWNLRARFLARGGFADAFAPELEWSHVDYPLLVPTAVARAWLLTRGEALLAPALVAAQLWAATLGLLFAGLERLRGTTTAAAGVAVALSASFFTAHAALQYADVPVGQFLLGAVVLGAFGAHVSPAAAWRPLALAGAHAGLAVWTKNEGALMLVALILAAASTYRWWSCSRRLAVAAVALGALVPLLLVLTFKASFAPRNDIVAAQSTTTTWLKLTDGWRWSTTLLGVGACLWTFGAWPWTTPILLCVAALPARLHRSSRFARGAGLALSLMLAGFVVVYVVTPLDLEGHMSSSANRLVLQLWPAAVFVSLLGLEAGPAPWQRGLSAGAVVLAALLPLCGRTTAWRDAPVHPVDDLEAPLGELTPLLPANGRVGLMTGAGASTHMATWFRAQYALAPRVLVCSQEERVLVVMPAATVQDEDRYDVLARGSTGIRVLRRRGSP